MVEGGLESDSGSANGVGASGDLALDVPQRAAASAATSAELVWLNEVWSRLPVDVREAVLSLSREAMRGDALEMPAADQAGTTPFPAS